MSEFWRNIFYAFIAELFVVIIALLAKEDKRWQVLILAIGTIIAGIIGFRPVSPPPTEPKSTAVPKATATLPVFAATEELTPLPEPKSIKQLYADEFNSSTAENWDIVSGSLEIKNGTFGGSSTCGGVNNVGVIGKTEWSDVNISFDVIGENGADKDVIFGYLNIDNYYGIHFTTGYNNLILQKAVNGKLSEITLTNYRFENGTWYHFQIQTTKNQIKVYVDNNLRIDYIDTDVNAVKGKFGIWITSGGATCPQSFWIDNLLVTTIE
jgi:hypothetical protein